LIGLEREFYQQKEDRPDFAGIRTFSLIALLGAVTAYLIDDLGIILLALAFAGLILLSAVSYFGSVTRNKAETGITTEVAALLTFLFGVLVMSDHALVAISLTNRSQIAIDVAGSAVIIAALVNTIAKVGIAYVSGTKELHRPVIKAFSFMLLVGILSSVVVFFLV